MTHQMHLANFSSRIDFFRVPITSKIGRMFGVLNSYLQSVLTHFVSFALFLFSN